MTRFTFDAGPNLVAVLDEDGHREMSSSPLRMTVAVVADAMGEGVDPRAVAYVRRSVERCDKGLAPESLAEPAVQQALRYKPALLEVLDDLVGPTPDRAYATLQAMGLAERGGAL